MRTLAIGDIHGCLTALNTLLAEVDPQPDDTIVTLGDYVDRGPDSRGVIDRLLTLKQTHKLIALRGNHEEMMLEARTNLTVAGNWLLVGGSEALGSYGIWGLTEGLSAIPESHWDFLENQCLLLWENETHLFVHANVDPDYPLQEQRPHVLQWALFDGARPHISGKIMVCGHTSQKDGLPNNRGYAICIDTWAHGRGWLTCLEVETGTVHQANQSGQYRQFHLSELE